VEKLGDIVAVFLWQTVEVYSAEFKIQREVGDILE
jgi:hypothetical protein